MTLKNQYENVNHLVLNFYPDGYSIAVKLNEFPVFTSETILETARISYEENSLLDYIENEELPPLLVEMIDSSPKLSQYKIWHDGCLILEVRDKIGNIPNGVTNDGSHDEFAAKASQFVKKNWSSSPRWLLNQNDCLMLDHIDKSGNINASDESSFFILLKPTNLSMLYDVLNLTDSNCWSNFEKLQLESQIVLHNSPTLTLDLETPRSPHLEFTSNTSHAKKRKLPHTKLKILPHRQPAAPPSNAASINQSRFGYMKLDKSNSNNGGGSNNNHPRDYLVFHDHYTQNQELNYNTPDGLPPRLALQQFIATRKAKRKSLPAGITPRFHRFKKKIKN